MSIEGIEDCSTVAAPHRPRDSVPGTTEETRRLVLDHRGPQLLTTALSIVNWSLPNGLLGHERFLNASFSQHCMVASYIKAARDLRAWPWKYQRHHAIIFRVGALCVS
jgi:hypothetical protein